MQPYATARRARRAVASTLAPTLALALALGACAPLARDVEPAVVPPAPVAASIATSAVARDSVVADRLVFGRAIGDSALVSDEDWNAFMRDVVTPRLSGGLTVWRAEGQWLDARGAVIREPVMVIELLHAPDAALEATLDAIAESYRRRFRQESVLRVTTAARLRLYDGRDVATTDGGLRP